VGFSKMELSENLLLVILGVMASALIFNENLKLVKQLWILRTEGKINYKQVFSLISTCNQETAVEKLKSLRKSSFISLFIILGIAFVGLFADKNLPGQFYLLKWITYIFAILLVAYLVLRGICAGVLMNKIRLKKVGRKGRSD
jgi:hypothetical protein